MSSDLRNSIRSIPDYPKPGIIFRDITTLLGDARAFRRAIDELVQPWAGTKIDKVAGIEARGFILGGAVAHQLSAGFVPIRKKGKLPRTTVSIAYSLEYGLDEMEMHDDAVLPGERVILVDDLIATGGTATAAVSLLKRIGAGVEAACFVIDLPDLGGAQKIRDLGVPVRTLMEFAGPLTMFAWRSFDALTARELHDLLKLRADVFVVEQACVFPEIDGRDPEALHLLLRPVRSSPLAGTLRLFGPERVGEAAVIGRVATAGFARGSGLGRALMAEGIAEARRRFGSVPIRIGAQTRLESFYGSFGFQRTGEDYVEDGIVHCAMSLILS